MDPTEALPPAPLPPDQRVGVAVVGLGRLSLGEILPALAQCQHARLAALVSGSPEKLALTARQYGIAPDHCYDYAGFDRIADDPAVQVVYIVLPNAMHREYTGRAAATGKHVLCEKPMAMNAAEAQDMIAACAAARVRLMVAYRIHFQPHNRALKVMVLRQDHGRLVAASCTNVQTAAPDAQRQWRHKAAQAGGGALPDTGIYCINTMRFITGRKPVAVQARLHSPPGDPRFAEVEETVSFALHFADGFTANCVASYGARDDKRQVLNFAKASADLAKAYNYTGQALTLHASRGVGDSAIRIVLPPANQFVAEIDHMARCILTGRRPRTPGEAGLRDHLVTQAIYEAAATGGTVPVPTIEE